MPSPSLSSSGDGTQGLSITLPLSHPSQLSKLCLERHTHTPPHTAWYVFVSTEQDGVTKQISKARLPHPQHIGDTFLPGTSPSTAQSTNIRPCLIVSSVQSSLDVRQARIWPLPSAYCLLPWMQEPCSLQDGSHAVPVEHCGCSHEPQRSLEEPQRRLASE